MNDRARALSPSPALVGLLRLVEALGERVDHEPTLPLAKAHAIESVIETELTDDLLVVLASKSSILRTATGLTVEGILAAPDTHVDDVPEGWVPISVVYHDPFAELHKGAHGGPYEVLTLARGGADILVITEGQPAAEPTTIAAFARDKIEAWYRRFEAWLEQARRSRTSEPWPFSASLVGDLPSAAPAATRWVTHPTLGRGELLSTRDDAWTVRFASGEKVIKAKFLTVES